MKFLDQVQIYIESGSGGPGAASFRREKYVPRGGPDGGDGGKGGDLLFHVNPGMNTLLHLSHKRKYRAENGRPGEGNLRTGADGSDLVLEVPQGTLVKSKDGEVLLDLKEKDKTYLFLKGGRGGKGNNHFKSSINQAPTKVQPGESGIQMDIVLELKLMADVGLVGYPNAGKSTLISVISAAKPKIADYPFTTLKPSLGMVDLGEGYSCVVADIPGLIPGAHKGVGLGTQFLKHIERTRVFIHLVDASPFAQQEPVKAYQDIMTELEEHDKMNRDLPGYQKLTGRKQMVVLNKLDTIDESQAEELKKAFQDIGVEVLIISATSHYGLQSLKYKLKEILYGKTESE
tara:strand:+ start:6188 stop:7222 length:1035 start_codon:yes stop_codon:yes gene_type:complete